MQQYMINNEQIVADKIVLMEDDLFHIFKVMRMKENDQIICANYESKIKYLCFIDANKNIVILNEITNDNELSHQIVLAFALVSNDKFEFVVQKACELGVSKLIPFISQHSQVKYDDKKLSKKLVRWQKIIKEATEQAKRNVLMEIVEPVKLTSLIDYDIKQKIIAYENEENKRLSDVYQKDDVLIVIGSEGGFSKNEVDHLNNHGFTSISLGKSILRCETAAVASVAIINELMESK